MRAAGCLNGNLRQAVRALQFETYGINIVQYLANNVNYICAKAKKRMPASGIRYKSLEQQETGKNDEDDGDNTEHDVCQTIFLFLLLGAASL